VIALFIALVVLFLALGVIVLRRLIARQRGSAIQVEAPVRDPAHDLDSRLRALLLQRVLEEKWIHRRVDSIRFVGPRRIRRHVSIDAEVPASLRAAHHDVEYDRPWSIVPLAFFDKRNRLSDQELLRDFDLRDESGQALANLETTDGALAVWSMLAVAAATDGRCGTHCFDRRGARPAMGHRRLARSDG
jgi:hypothetical protein